jgi:Cu+-exporting ATPase
MPDRSVSDTTVLLEDTAAPPRPLSAAAGQPAEAGPDAVCYHCGLACPPHPPRHADKVFCCQGCLTVYELLAENGLEQFYELNRHPGRRAAGRAATERFAYLDEPALQAQLLDFTDGRTSRVTFRVPAIHCVACVWLLENLFRLHPGVGRSVVDFTRREVAIWFSPERIKLSELVALLVSIGYEPVLTPGELDKRPGPDPARRRLHLQVGVAGFAFGNIMLFSLPLYLGLDSLSGPLFRAWFGGLSLLLALPVLVFSAADYFRSAWLSVRQRLLTLDVPIAAGLVALYGWSAYEILSGHGPGYLDSLAGLVFFLLGGKIFQARTYARLAFDADYRSFFPLAVTRLTGTGEETVALGALRVGDRLRVRHGELIPADARLLEGAGAVDYSFVTGEAEPVPCRAGDRLYAGGRVVGGSVVVETMKPVSQSYLTSLWNHATFAKDHRDPRDTWTNRYSRRFTPVVVGIALAALAGWLAAGQGARALKAFTAVLIVACPCALALAAPFSLGTAHRLLGRRGFFLKNPQVLERLARVDTVVLDKTGTLTLAGGGGVRWVGLDAAGLSPADQAAVRALVAQSTHPYAVRLRQFLENDTAGRGTDGAALPAVAAFEEIPGGGLRGRVAGREYRLGARAWLAGEGVVVPSLELPAGSAVHLAVAGAYRGAFVLASAVRPGAEALIAELRPAARLYLLSGDNDQERAVFAALFGPGVEMHFNQSPLDKLEFVAGLRAAGRRVLMVGDGLNDAGALREADVGVAVVEEVGTFAPASDLIAAAAEVPRLGRVLALARRVERVVQLNFAVSALYNAVGVSIAAAGVLSPVICAVLMPLSSVTVVTLASGLTARAAERLGLGGLSPLRAGGPDLESAAG